MLHVQLKMSFRANRKAKGKHLPREVMLWVLWNCLSRVAVIVNVCEFIYVSERSHDYIAIGLK